MELLESQDPEKKKLLETSDRHRQEMEREIKDISEKTERVLKNALIIGGALALTFIVVSQLGSSKSRKKKLKDRKEEEKSGDEISEVEAPSLISKLGDKAMNMATMFLLDLAKEKLSEYLQQRKSKNEDS
jgi:FtsZ-interacting cell division protein ZipA